jgi:hypothetical protein
MAAVSSRKRAAARVPSDDLPPLLETTLEEGREIFDQQARLRLGMSGEEFLRRWNAGEYEHTADLGEPGVMDVVMLLPLVQPTHQSSQR